MLDVSIKDQTTHGKGHHVRCVYKYQTTHGKGQHVRCVYKRSNNTW